MNAVITMNNSAARMIEQKEFKEAIDLLSQSLGIVQRAFDEESSDSDDTPSVDNADAESSSKVKSQTPKDEIENDNDVREETSEEDEEEEDADDQEELVYSCKEARMMQLQHEGLENGLVSSLSTYDYETEGEDFIYRHPIRAVEIPQMKDPRYIMSVIIVFNMALAHHLNAIDESNDLSEEAQEERLEGALKLYELGFCMQMKGDVAMDMTYALAMINNCAHIYKTLNRTQKAARYCERMLSSLMMMIENNEADTVDELDGFLYNASKLILQTQVAAAA